MFPYLFPYLFCLAGAAWAICVIDIKVVYYGDLGGFVSACCLFAVLFEIKSALPRLRLCCGCIPLDYLIRTLSTIMNISVLSPFP